MEILPTVSSTHTHKSYLCCANHASMKSTNLTKCSRSWSPKCLIMGSTLQAKWNPQTRQSFRLSFRSSTCCKTELQHAQTQHARAFHHPNTQLHLYTSSLESVRVHRLLYTYLMADGSLLCRTLRIQYFSHPPHNLCVAPLHSFRAVSTANNINTCLYANL